MTLSLILLGDAVRDDGGILQTGPFGSQLKQAEYSDDGVPVIMPKDIRNGEVATETVARVPEATADRLMRHRIAENGIVLPRRGEVTKRAFIGAQEAGWLCGTGCLKIETKGKRIWPKYLYYYMGTPASIDWLEKNAVGSTMLNLSAEIVSRFPLRLPLVEEQKRIADILSAYDDLIENNRRRIALLEEAARMLYREWFVHLRFPGHEHVKITDGLPEGWERRTLAELADDVSYGFTASADHEVEGPRFLRITDIVNGPIDWSSVPRCPITPDKQQRFLLAPDDIVVARTGATTGWARRVGRPREPAVFASYLVRFRFSERVHPVIAAIFMQSDQYKAFIKGNLGGAAQPNAGAKVLGSAMMPVPLSSLQRGFADAVIPMLDQIDLLSEQNEKLAEARDLLLPRLMNGEIAV